MYRYPLTIRGRKNALLLSDFFRRPTYLPSATSHNDAAYRNASAHVPPPYERREEETMGEGSKTSKNDLPPKSAVGSSNGLAWSAWSFSDVEVAPGVVAAVASAPPPPPPPPPPPDAEFSFSMPVPWNAHRHAFVTEINPHAQPAPSRPLHHHHSVSARAGRKTRSGGGGTGFARRYAAHDIYDGIAAMPRRVDEISVPSRSFVRAKRRRKGLSITSSIYSLRKE